MRPRLGPHCLVRILARESSSLPLSLKSCEHSNFENISPGRHGAFLMPTQLWTDNRRELYSFISNIRFYLSQKWK